MKSDITNGLIWVSGCEHFAEQQSNIAGYSVSKTSISCTHQDVIFEFFGKLK